MKNLILITTAIFSAFIASCSNEEDKKNESFTIVNMTNSENSETTFTSNKITASVTSEINSKIVSKGICWSKNPNPTINNESVKLENNNFSYYIEKLTANTTYYYRIFAMDNQGIKYSDNTSFKTLSLDSTTWKFISFYTQDNFFIESKVDFFENGTTKFDEIGPGQGSFITNGTWSLNGNQITYIWSGNQPENSTYIYNGIISGMTITGTFSHPSVPGTFNATILN